MQRRTHGLARGRVWRGGAPWLALLAVGVSVLVAGFVAPPASAATDSYTVTANLGVGELPTSAAVDASTHKIYVENSNASADTLSIIDGTTNTVTGSSGACMDSFGLAVDPTTHKVYSACDNDPPSPATSR